jgi:DNA-binding transcriptional ArsR family regulator
MAKAVPSKLLDEVFSALSHPSRRQILVILHARGGEMTAGEIADRFKHSWPTTTRHLGVLEKARVLQVGKQGRQRFYKLRSQSLVRAAEWLCSWAEADEDRDDRGPSWKKLPYATMRNAIPVRKR